MKKKMGMTWKNEYNRYILILGILVMALAVEGGGKKASKECLDGCKPICMKLDKACEYICDMACNFGCVQLLGKGPPTDLPLQFNKGFDSDAKLQL